jgi:hypothetical protein
LEAHFLGDYFVASKSLLGEEIEIPIGIFCRKTRSAAREIKVAQRNLSSTKSLGAKEATNILLSCETIDSIEQHSLLSFLGTEC